MGFVDPNLSPSLTSSLPLPILAPSPSLENSVKDSSSLRDDSPTVLLTDVVLVVSQSFRDADSPPRRTHPMVIWA